MISISTVEHPGLEAIGFATTYPRSIGEMPSPEALLSMFGADADVPLQSDDEVRACIRDLLRFGGFRPTGRSKPASEYLIKAVAEGWLSPQKGINLAVDACNVVSLHSGLPISVVDLDLAKAPFSIQICPPKTEYVFNPSGQVIDVGGLITLCDADGPCAGPVKDSQRTKTHDGTLRTLSIVWGSRALTGRTATAVRWYRELLHASGANTEDVAIG